MIDLYTWPTPNGFKASIMLEETGLDYQIHAVNINAGDQFKPDFLSISPNNKIPAIRDQNGSDGKTISVFESGAILIYLARKSQRFLPQDPQKEMQVLQWLMFQMSGIGPMFGQAGHFRHYASTMVPEAIERYTKEAGRLLNVMDKRLTETQYLAGDDYSIADIATYPWMLRLENRQGQNIDDFPNVKRWIEIIQKRPAVQRGTKVLADRHVEHIDDTARKALFGSDQFEQTN